MKDVEVPEVGTVVVQDGEVHDVTEYIPVYDQCLCDDKKHARRFWARNLEYGRTGVEPHPIGIQRFELTWEVKK